MLPSLRSRRSAEVPSLFDSLWTDMDSFFNDTVQYTSDQGDLVVEIEAPGFNKDNIPVTSPSVTFYVNQQKCLLYIGSKYNNCNICGKEDDNLCIDVGDESFVICPECIIKSALNSLKKCSPSMIFKQKHPELTLPDKLFEPIDN